MKTRTDQGQALIMVMAMSAVLLMLGAMLVQVTMGTDTSVQNNLIQRYSYRALEAGENYYMNVVNANPNAVNCSTATWGNVHFPNCQSVQYDTWNPVPNITTTHGASPESYLFGNPQPQINPATGVLTSVQVQVVGVAGSHGKYIYSSSVVNLQPENGFLDNIWWTNFEAFDPNANVRSGSYANCLYDWQNSYSGPGGDCVLVPFSVTDNLNGPVYSNDSIYVDNAGGLQANGTSGVEQPSFNGGPVVTADPNCLFVSNPLTTNGGPNDSSPTSTHGCQYAGTDYVATYDHVNSSNNHPIETPPPSDTQLAAVAAAHGCLYSGPTTITLTGSSMNITSPDTPATSGVENNSGNGLANDSGNTNTCHTDGTPTTIPANGVVFVQTATPSQTVTGANPFDGYNGAYPQTVTNGCPGCYYGQSNQPDAEADVFVSGSLSGQVTIGSQNNIIIDGNITYQDCTWGGTPGQSLCKYNPGTNDALGLIAANYVEVNHPVTGPSTHATVLPLCGIADLAGVVLPPPLCDPGSNLTIEAAILALNQSFVVNNYSQMSLLGLPEGILTVYGAMAQFARGPVGTYSSTGLVSGYTKDYTWDPRLALYSPPSYLQPGTPAWGLGPSSTAFVTFPSCLAPWPNPTPPLTCPQPP